MGRYSRIAAAACLLIIVWVSTALAAKIDPELQRILDEGNKSEADMIPVLMVFPEQPDVEDLEVMLDGATPNKRRKSTIAALKRQARKAQADVWELFDDPDHPGILFYADMLYFSNAIAFGGDRDVILAVAEAHADKAGDDAILFLDKDYDLLAGLPARTDGLKSAMADTAWNVKYLQAHRVWKELGYTGEGIVIGHLDTGVDYNHPDLKQRIRINPLEIADNGIDDDDNGFVDDLRGWDFGDGDADPLDDASNASHGTHTAGSAVGDGTGGVQTGVAPGARLLPVKIFTSDGTASLGRIWAGQQYCVENGARIITMSLGVKGEIPAAFLRNDRYNAGTLRAAGVIVFNSAGNYHDEFDPPIELGMTARIPAPWSAVPAPYSSTGGVITVGGTGFRSDESYGASSHGPAAWDQVEPWFDWPYLPGDGLIKPDVVAPAQGIVSTLPDYAYSGETWGGTSMACPQAAGVAALMLQKNPTLSPAGVDSLLELTARDLGAPGKDVIFGSGLIDAYAAVLAVPNEQLPNLDNVTFLPDPQGDGSLDPGELVSVVFEVDNAGFVPATGVVGRLTVENNPYVGVQDALAVFPDAQAASQISNADSPFTVAVSPQAPQGHVFCMNLTLSTAEGFERIFDVKGYVGLPEVRTHDEVGNLFMSVTSRGSLGYLDDSQISGYGLGLRGGPSSVFLGSLWAGSRPDYVCNNDFTAAGADPAEWQPRGEPSGNVRVVTDNGNQQAFGAAFTDAGAVIPLGVTVSMVSRAYDSAARENVFIIDYVITNAGNAYFDRYYAGLFIDWDVIDSLGNIGGVDPSTRSVWVGMPNGPVFGMALLGDTPVSNVTLIDNPTYVYPVSHVIGHHKFQLLNGSIRQTEATQPTDLSALVSAGPFNLEPGDQVRVSFVLAFGENVEAFQANIAAAGAGSGPVATVDHEKPVLAPVLALGQNHPNPFNPSTMISFTLPRNGTVGLAIYDVTGRRVRSLVSDDLDAGSHVVRWDGRNEVGQRAASGMYFYKLEAGGSTLTRKMLLVK